MAIIAILAGLLLPALGKAKAKGQAAVCMGNLRQLQLAWQLYADESGDIFVHNVLSLDDGIICGLPGSWVLGNALGSTNLTNITAGSLYPYLRSVGVYRCPGDRTTFYRLDRTRTSIPVHRSYSINHPLNTSGAYSLPVYPRPYTYARKSADLVVPGPSQTWVFIEPTQDSHWGPTFDHYISQDVEWGHMPTDRHSKGCQLSFADGHVSSMRWKAPKEVRSFREFKLIQAGADRDDYHRLLAGLPRVP